MSDDYPSNSTTTGVVSIGSSTTGTIEVAGDTDWFGVSLTAGSTYQFDLMGNPSGHGTLVDPALTLFDGSGTQLAYNDDIGGGDWDSRISYTPTTSGTYYLSAASRGGPGTYRIAATQTDDYGSTPSTAGTLAVGSLVTGNIEASGDTDWFAVTVTAGHMYQFDLQGNPSGNGTLADPCMWLMDSSGNQIAYNDDIGGGDWDSRITYTATSSGTIYLAAGSRGGPGTYRAVAADLGAVENLSAGSSLSGDIAQSGERDRYAVTLVAGHTYQFDLQGNPSGNGTLADPALWLNDSNGNQIAYDDDISSSNWDSRITYTATSNGTFYLDAGSRSGPGTYQISATEVLTAGTSTSGAIADSHGTYTYAVSLVAGHAYEFDLQGAPSGNGTLADPCLWILDSSGNTLFYNDDIGGGNWDSRFTYTPSQSGTYLLRAGSRGAPGTYTLSSTDKMNADDFSATTATLGSVNTDTPASGTINFSGDQDWFAVTVTANHTYQFDLQGAASGNGTLTDPYLSLLDGTGSLITSNDNASGSLDSRITWRPTTTGTYYLSASSALSGGTGSYQLSMSQVGIPADDYSSSTSTTGTVAIGGAATGDIEQPGDRDWFAVSLTAGRAYEFYLQGNSSGNGTLGDPYLRLVDSTGNGITANDDSRISGTDSAIGYTATATGTYFLEAGDVGSAGVAPDFGTYRVAALDTTTDNLPSSISTPLGVTIGSYAYGGIRSAGHADWYYVDLTGGHTYQFDLGGGTLTASSELANPYLELRDSSGSLISSNDDAVGLNSRITYTPTSSGRYFLAASSSGGTGTGGYRVSASDVTIDDFGSSVGYAGSMLVGVTKTGNIQYGDDTDWFGVSLTKGATYKFTIAGSAGSGGYTLASPFLQLENTAYYVPNITSIDAGADGATFTYTPIYTSTYYIGASSAAQGGTGTYGITVTQTDDFGSTLLTAGSLNIGYSQTGVINYVGDTDAMVVNLVPGRTYQFDLTSGGSGGALADPYLTLEDASGSVLATNDDTVGLNSRIVYSPTSFGNYILLAGAAPGGGVGSYTLSSTDITDDYGTTDASAGTISVGSSKTGGVNFGGDHDWFAVSVVAGRQYTFDLQGTTTGQGTLADPFLALRDVNGNLITSNDDAVGHDSRIIWTAPTSAAYILDVSSPDSNATGTYRLVATDSTDDYAGDSSTTGSVTVNGASASGTIGSPSDTDWFAVNLTSGTTYQFDLKGNSTGYGTLVDPALTLFNGSGTQLAYNDDVSGSNWDSRITFTATTTGTYFLQAASRSGVGTYSLFATA